MYCSIVQQTRSGVEFYMKGFPELEGMHYRAARRAFDSAVICGYQDATGQLHVNPDEDAVLQAGDRVIALAQTGQQHALQLLEAVASCVPNSLHNNGKQHV